MVFGRAAAIRAGKVVDAEAAPAALNKALLISPLIALMACVTQVAQRQLLKLRLEMQKTMQEDAAVFRTDQNAERRRRKDDERRVESG